MFTDNAGLDQLLQDALLALKNAAGQAGHPFRTPILATLNGNKPELRTIILRDFLADPYRLVFFTHGKSPKVAQIRNNPKTACSVYDPRSASQLRINGKATIHQADDISRHYWPMVPLVRYADYNPKIVPGNPLTETADQDVSIPPDSLFAVVSLEIQEIDILLIKPEGHKRAFFKKDKQLFRGSWVQP